MILFSKSGSDDGRINIKTNIIYFLIGLTAIFFLYNSGRSFFGPKKGEDFAQYYTASRLLAEKLAPAVYRNEDLYQKKAKSFGISPVEGSKVMTCAYPPALAFILMPLAALSYAEAMILFFLLNIFLMFLVPFLVFDAKAEKGELILWGTGLNLLFFPNYYSLYMGQINSVLLLFCVLSLFFMKKNRDILSALFLALAIVIKLFPAVLLFFCLAERRFKIIVYTLIWISVLTLLSLSVFDVEDYIYYFGTVLPLQLEGGAWYRNQGISGFVSRMFSANEYVLPLVNSPALAQTVKALFIGGIGLSLTLLSFRKKQDPQIFSLKFFLFLHAAILAASKSWEHYAVCLVPEILIFLEIFCLSRGKYVLTALITGMFFGIWSFTLNTGVDYESLPKNFMGNMIMSSKFFASFIFYCALWGLAFKKAPQQN